MSQRHATAATLALCLAASQAALLTLTPILASIAADFDVSTATAGQLRTISGLTAGVTALLTGLAAARIGLRELLLGGLVLVAVGTALSALAPHFAVLAVAQAPIGIGVGLTYSAAVAAVADWSRPDERSRVLALALLGPPLAWIFGMPIAGVAGDVTWRWAWVAVPLVLALAGIVALVLRSSSPPAVVRAGLRRVLGEPGVVRWSLGELLAYSAWLGVLLFIGALFVEVHGLSVAATGLALGVGALAYIPGNLLFRRWVDDRGRLLLVTLALACAAVTAALGAVRLDAWVSLAALRRTLVSCRWKNAGRERTRPQPRAGAAPRRDGRSHCCSPVRRLRRCRGRRRCARSGVASRRPASRSPRCSRPPLFHICARLR